MERRVDAVLAGITIAAPLVVTATGLNGPARCAEVLREVLAAEDDVECVADYGALRRRGDRYTDRWVVLAETQARIDAFGARVALRLGREVPFVLGASTSIQPRRLERSAEGSGTVKFQMGSPSHYAHVVLRIEPLDADAIVVRYAPAVDFLVEWVAEHDRAQWIEPMFAGVVDAAKLAARDGQPCRGICVTITAGRFHAVDSRPNDFACAASLALEEALGRAH